MKIVHFQTQYAAAFKELNQDWIEKYFKMEAEDYYALDHPQENIIDKGGYILIALLDDVPVGACALKKMDHEIYDYELAKMGVSPDHQGKGIGRKLGEAILALAEEKNAKAIFLETNTKLQPAIALYHKLGFQEVKIDSSPYERSNYCMEYLLDS